MVLLSAKAQQHSVDTVSHLREVVITGTRTPKLLKDAPVQTRLITADDIKKADATNIQDLLQTEMPGVEFTYAMNQQTHLNFAGFGGQGVLFLVDGERLAGETLDDVDFNRLNMSDVQRIEIVRGASSALYGSNAGGGVVNIITKDSREPWTLNVKAKAGTHRHQRYGAQLNLCKKKWSNALDLIYSGTDNFNVSNGPAPKTSVFSTVFGDKTFQAKEKLTLQPLDGLKISGRAGYFFRTLTRIVDTPERYRDFNGGLRAVWILSETDHLELSYSFDEYDKSDYQRLTGLDVRDYSNVQNSIRSIWNHRLGEKNILTVGADYMHDYLFSANLSNKNLKQNSFDVFGQTDWIISKQWELVGALRYDYLDDGHHSQLTPKLSARYHANRHLTFRMAYGMGFRAPTLKEKYYNFDMAGIWIVEGNSGLEPETSHHLNLSAEWTKGHYNLTATTYYNRVRNKLTTGLPHTKPNAGKQLFLDYLNLDNYSVYGAEATLQARWDNGLGARFSYAYTKEQLAKDHDGNTVNNQYIPAREHSLTTRLEWNHQWTSHYALNIALYGRYVSSVSNIEYADYYDISKGTVHMKYPAYSLWKLQMTHHLGNGIRLTMTVDNLFNYRPEYYYMNAPVTDGTTFQTGFSIDIEKL